MPFEIFSEEERTQFTHYASTSMNSGALKYLLNRLNYGIHGTNGWIDQLNAHAKEIKDEENSDILQKSLLRHMVTAKALQQNPAGELTERLLPKKFENFIEKYGNHIGISKTNEPKEFSDSVDGEASHFAIEMNAKSYQNFWDDYLYQIIITYIKSLINKNEASHNRLAKPIVFIFSRLKHLIKQGGLFSNRTSYSEQLEKEITRQAKSIHAHAELSEVFCLNEESVAFINSEKKCITELIKEIISLRKKFESNPVIVRYVHVLPEILVQFAQLLDYTISHLEESGSQNDTAILEILRRKREEFAVVMVFQEELHTKYGHEDFIQTLQSILQNKEPEFLPTESFYNFVESKPIALVAYDSSPDAPKLLTREESTLWRESCPFLMKAKNAVLCSKESSEEIGRNKDVFQRFPLGTTPFCGEMKILYLVQNDNACVISIPKFAFPTVFKPKDIELTPSTQRSHFLSPFAKPKSFNQTKRDESCSVNTTTAVFAFFVKQQQERTTFQQCFAQFKESLELNKRRTLAHYDYLPRIFSKGYNADLEAKYLSRVQNLIAQRAALKGLFAGEYKLLEDFLIKTQDLEEKQVLMTYRKAMDEAKENLNRLLSEVLAHWQNELNKFPILQGGGVEIFKAHMKTLQCS